MFFCLYRTSHRSHTASLRMLVTRIIYIEVLKRTFSYNSVIVCLDITFALATLHILSVYSLFQFVKFLDVLPKVPGCSFFSWRACIPMAQRNISVHTCGWFFGLNGLEVIWQFDDHINWWNFVYWFFMTNCECFGTYSILQLD